MLRRTPSWRGLTTSESKQKCRHPRTGKKWQNPLNFGITDELQIMKRPTDARVGVDAILQS